MPITPEQMAALHPDLFRVSAQSSEAQWTVAASLLLSQIAALRAAIQAGKQS